MSKQQEFRKQTEEAKLEAFSLMCKKVADLEKENAELKETAIKMNNLITKTFSNLTKATELLAKWVELFKPKGGNIPPTPIQVDTEQFLKEIEK